MSEFLGLKNRKAYVLPCLCKQQKTAVGRICVAQSEGRQWTIRCYLENMQILFHPPCLDLKDTLRIRRVLETERKTKQRVVTRGLDLDIDSETCVVETSVPLKSNLPDTPEPRAQM